MTEILGIVKQMYAEYNGSGMHMALFFACMLYLLMQKKEKEKDKSFLFVGYTLLFFVLIYFPVTAKMMLQVLGEGENVYWRIFWILPTTIVMAYTGTCILMECSTKAKRLLLLAVMVVMLALSGTTVYNPTIFAEKQNNYKIPNDTIGVCESIKADALENGIEWKKVLVGNELLSTIRQYDADILMPYGQSMTEGGKAETDGAAQLYRILNSTDKNWEAFSFYMEQEKCNYFAYPKEDAVTAVLGGYGFQQIGDTGNYYVYRRHLEDVRHKGQWLVTQYGGAEGNQMSFYTLQDTSGHLVVIDGGWREDATYVRKTLKALGNHVNAWIITHPHQDHAGAFCKIYKKPKNLVIDAVYAVDMAAPELCLENAPWDETIIYEKWLKLNIPQVSYVYAGDRFEVAGLNFEIFNAYAEYVDEISNDLLNDGSMLFKVTAQEESMLFCADVGKRMSDYLLETYGEALQADYIQMGHHGNGGLKKRFYKSIGAKAAFFDAPNWLMEDSSGDYTTPENAALMKKQGAKVYSFATTPNQIVIK